MSTAMLVSILMPLGWFLFVAFMFLYCVFGNKDDANAPTDEIVEDTEETVGDVSFTDEVTHG